MTVQLGVLSSSLFRIMTGHAKCDAMLTAIAHTAASATTAECHELPAAFATQEFQRHAFPPASADRRSLKGSYYVPLTAVAALLRTKTPFFLRETLQRALVDERGDVVDSFADARIVHDSTKRTRGLSQLEAQNERLADAEAHWNSLRRLLAVIDDVLNNNAAQYDFLEIPPCHCISCRKHVDPRANVRLLIFAFEPDMRFVDIVVARRRGKSSPSSATSPRNNIVFEQSDDSSPDTYFITATAPAPAQQQLPSLDSFSVPPPPPLPATFALADVADSITKSLSGQLIVQMRESMRAELDAQVDAAVESATKVVRERYESRLLQSQDEVRALRNQVDQLQRQLAQMSLGTTPNVGKNDFLDTNDDSSLDDLFVSSVSSMMMRSPPRKRRQLVDAAPAAPALHASSTTLCRRETSSMWEMPPHSPTEFVY